MVFVCFFPLFIDKSYFPCYNNIIKMRKDRNMNSKTLEKLEFRKICEIISDFAITYMGKNWAREIMPMTGKKDIEKSLHQTSEALMLLYRLGNPPISEIADITISFKQLENANSLNQKQLLDLSHILEVSQNQIGRAHV